MMVDKDMINALADALLGSGSAEETPGEQQRWYVCVPDLTGVVQRFETTNLFQAKIAVEDWLTAGHPAWLQDESGKELTIAPKPRELN
jgi:predicted RNase H-like HicB family nuclease